MKRTPWLGLEFWQDGAARPITSPIYDYDNDRLVTVWLKRRPFEVRFPRLPDHVAAMICAWDDRTIFAVPPDALTNTQITEATVTCVSPGTGMADSEFGDGVLTMANDGHNHMIGNRVAHVSDSVDSAEFSQINDSQGSLTPLQQQSRDIYLLVVIDRNNDSLLPDEPPYEVERLLLRFSG